MGEPFSVAASAVGCVSLGLQLIELSLKVIEYGKGVKKAPKEMEALIKELELFNPLLARLQKFSEENPKSENIRTLTGSNGPLREYQNTLSTFVKKLQDGKGSKSGALKWPFTTEATRDQMMLVERQKSLCKFAMTSDILDFARKMDDYSHQTRDLIQSLMKSNTELQEIIRTTLAEGERNTVLAWLSSDIYHRRHNEIKEDRGENTCEWLLKTKEFGRWRDGLSSSRLLFGYGNPGAGKTILSSVVIDYFREQQETTEIGIASFYFNYKDERSKQTPSHVLSSLVMQLVDQLPGHLPKSLVELYQKSKPAQPAESDLLGILYDISNSLAGIFFVFDALDECSPKSRTKLLRLFKEMAKNRINLFLTSRPHLEDVQISLKDASKIEIVAQEVDVRAYVRQAMDESTRISEIIGLGIERKNKIVDEIVANSQGIFLLASFYTTLICQQTDEEEIQDYLKSLKAAASEERPLNHFYERAIDTIKEKSKSERQLAYRILSWLVKAKRALTVTELQVALAVKPEQYELKGRLKDRHTLTDVCASLVVIDQLSDTIRLAHFTVQEYLVDISQRSQGTDLNLQFCGASLELAKICITYLSFEIFTEGACTTSESLEGRLKDYPLLGYAANYLGLHLRDCDEDLTVGMLKRWLISSGGIDSYLQAHSLRTPMGLWGWNYYPRGKSPLHVASILGHLRAVQVLLKNGAKISAKDEMKDTALHNAIANGCLGVAEYLIKDGADPSAPGHYSLTPLHLAARCGYEAVVQLLLGNGSDTSALDNGRCTPLHIAAEGGHEAVVQLLLGSGSDPSDLDNYGHTPLHLAARSGHEAVVQLLLGNGSDPSALDNDECTPLHLAAESGHEAVVQLLLGNGSDPSAPDNDGYTPLHLAAWGGNEAVAQLLLGNGSDPSVPSNRGYTPLHIAVWSGHEAVVQLLLGNGSDPSAPGNNGYTPLHLAVWSRHEAVVQLLLGNGSDPSALGNDGYTPLQLAAQRGMKR